jgi:uncharacterized membrane protein YfcA
MSNFKDTFTTILAIILVVAGAINTYLQSTTGQEIDWYQLVLAVVAALVAYFTGKTATGAKKSDTELINQKEFN